MLYGIDVIVLQPGAVRTAIWDKAAALDVSVFAGTDYAAHVGRFRDAFVERGRAGLPPEDIARAVREALGNWTATPRSAP
jgi:NAD(P)-dependent dehydrogenase (short-subunit alcohol dehydrogenase family)